MAEIEGNRTLRAFRSCGPLAVRAKPWELHYRLLRRLSVDEEGVETTWWAQQSAPNSFQMPERMHDLRGIALAILELPAEEVADVGRLRLSIARTE